MADSNIRTRGIIHALMHRDSPPDREPTFSELGAALAYGMDDGDWCRQNNHDAEPPPNLRHPKTIAEWWKGYKACRGPVEVLSETQAASIRV